MQRISSSGTFLYKRVFPLVFLGLLGFFMYEAAADGHLGEDLILLVGPVFMALIGAFVYKIFISDLADEVIDHGLYLAVRRGSAEEAVYLNNIMNISVTQFVNPPRVTLRLVKPGKFGREVAFSPKVGFSLNPAGKPKIVDELIERTYAARNRSAA